MFRQWDRQAGKGLGRDRNKLKFSKWRFYFDGKTAVAAAGNQNQDACDYNPTWAPSAITVASYACGWGQVLVERLIKYRVWLLGEF